MSDRWKCPRCGDDMSVRFLKSHTRICQWVSSALSIWVDFLLWDLGL